MASYVELTQPIAGSGYQVDDRVTVFQPLEPVSVSIFDGPTLIIESGIRVNTDASGV